MRFPGLEHSYDEINSPIYHHPLYGVEADLREEDNVSQGLIHSDDETEVPRRPIPTLSEEYLVAELPGDDFHCLEYCLSPLPSEGVTIFEILVNFGVWPSAVSEHLLGKDLSIGDIYLHPEWLGPKPHVKAYTADVNLIFFNVADVTQCHLLGVVSKLSHRDASQLPCETNRLMPDGYLIRLLLG
ncbi:MAG: hypothetical protein DDT29_02368 [Dehalococcoidia bacterium]|nr:hypothetical protein [Bacillota bacterium]